MQAVILIIVLNLHSASGYANNSVIMQEFNSLAQCQYAAKLIRDTSSKHNMASIQCVNK